MMFAERVVTFDRGEKVRWHQLGALVEQLGDRDIEIVIEPGRAIAGNAGILLTEVLYLKHTQHKNFAIIDAAMNDLIRPAMYGAWHDIVPVTEAQVGTELHPIDVVGPVCETGDTFTRQRPLPPMQSGDLVAFRSAGAYGAVMASEYNTRPLIPEVLVHEHQFAVIRSRPTFDEIINRDTIPSWLEGSA